MNPSAITTMRRENEAGAIVALAMMAALFTMLLAIGLSSCANAEEISEDQAIQCILGEARGEYAQYGYPALLGEDR